MKPTSRGLGRIANPAPVNKVTTGAARREKVYIWVIVAAWAFVPEIRRLADYAVGSGSMAAINLIPMVLMLPLFWQALKKRQYGRNMNFLLWTWLLGFGYALFVALASGGLIGAFYDLALFCMPLLAGLWVMNASLEREQLFEALTTASLAVATLVSIYGLYQYVRPPAWDANWVSTSGLGSVGVAEPFQLRIFSTLNSPATLAMFLVFTIVASLHRLTSKKAWPLVPTLLLCIFALAFTLVRSAYLALAVAILVYSFGCTHRRKFIGFGSVFAVLVLVGGLALPLIFGSEAGTTERLTSRLSTLRDVQNDPSTISRERQTGDAVREALDEPLGQGLGVVGTSARASSKNGSTVVLDNGYVSRWLEMGVVGFPAYLLAVFAALFFSVRRWFRAKHTGAIEPEINMLATSIAAQVALVGGDIAGDNHSQLSGFFFWVLVGLALKGVTETAVVVPLPSTLRKRVVAIPVRKPA